MNVIASVYTDSDKICQCKSKNYLKSVLFDKKARYDSSKNVCYVACDTNQYPANEYTECKSCDTTDSKIVPHSADAAEPYTCDCDEDKEYVTDGNSCMPCKSSEGFMIVGNHCHCDSVKNLKDKTVTQYGNATECEPYKGYTPDCNGSCSGGEKVVKASCDTDNKNKIVEEINTTTTKTKINDKFDDDDRFCRCPVFGEEAYDTLIAVLAGTKYHYSNDNDKNNLVELTCTAPCPDNVTSSDGVSCPEAVCPTEGTSEYTNFINISTLALFIWSILS